MIVVPTLSRLAQLDDIIAARLDGGSLRLFKNDIIPNETTALAAFTVADFTGYANKTIATWNAPYLDGQNKATVLAPLQAFTPTGTALANTIYGVYYLDAGGALVYAERFAQPIIVTGPTTPVNVVPRYQMGALAA